MVSLVKLIWRFIDSDSSCRACGTILPSFSKIEGAGREYFATRFRIFCPGGRRSRLSEILISTRPGVPYSSGMLINDRYLGSLPSSSEYTTRVWRWFSAFEYLRPSPSLNAVKIFLSVDAYFFQVLDSYTQIGGAPLPRRRRTM